MRAGGAMRWRRLFVSGLLLVYLLIGVSVGLRNTALRLRAAARTAGLSSRATRELAFGRSYVATVERIRHAIPVDEPYLLNELDEPGARLWVRFDLLPRRAVDERQLGRVTGGRRDCWLEQVRWKVVAVGARRPPLLLARAVRAPAGCPPAPWIGAGPR